MVVGNSDVKVGHYGPAGTPFKPTMEANQQLLSILGRFNSDFVITSDSRQLFSGLLEHFLKLTGSEYGFIGERLHRDNGTIYLKTHAISNVAWNDETLALYQDHLDEGLEFDKLDSLFGTVLTNCHPLISNDPKTDPRATGTPEGHPALRCFLGIPLFLCERFIGMVGIANREGGYDQGILDYLSPLTSSTAALIHAVRMDREARHDPMTGLANRRKLNECFDMEINRCLRYGTNPAMLMIDVDHFKQINDNFGHMVGDRALKHLSDIMANRLRSVDQLARYGGEEFAVLLPDTTEAEAVIVAEQLRNAVASRQFPLPESEHYYPLTISIGVAWLNLKENHSFDELVALADSALYEAKQGGRNCVATATCVVGR